ncbi:MAG: HPr(Ser) kinase/phosphatase [Clostridia bacterium]|nr:HPr(Ser) kinase/phosphatase [Clostridia bacterium]
MAISTIKLSDIISELRLEALYLGEEDREITTQEVARPGLPLAGFTELYQPQRFQIIGREECSFLDMLDNGTRDHNINIFMKASPVCVIFSSSLEPHPEFLKYAKKYDVPLLRTSERTSEFMASLISSMRVKLAPAITRHGVMVEVYGMGILILGDSGIGKSETAIELVKRGHRLIADDAVEIRKVSAVTLVASAPEIIRHYVELRGIGIVDVRRLFGVGSVKDTEKINMVIKLEPWVQGKTYDRIGLETEVTDIMGIELPTVTIPVSPGRNLSVIIEIAAMNQKQKFMGYNTAVEFNKRLTKMMEQTDSDNN